jgi:hypothetical protein
MLTTVQDYIDAKLTHSIHTTERRSFRGCRRRWNWIFREMYYPQVTVRPLEFGVACHVAFETYYDFYLGKWNNPDPETAAALAIAAFKRVNREQREKFKELNHGYIDPEMAADYEDREVQGVGMLKHYFTKVSPIEDRDLKPVKVEIAFEVPVTGPRGETLWCTCQACWDRWIRYCDAHDMDSIPRSEWKGLPVTFGGRIDALFEDQQGRYWIVDWKTAMRLSGEGNAPDNYLWWDDQINAYCWALWLIGIPIAGFIYAEIKKAFPEEPEPMKVTRKGLSYSVSKQQNTTYELYKQTVMENDTAAYDMGGYDAFLDWLKNEGPKFHLRHQIFRNEHELREVGVNIWKEATEMVDLDLEIYPNPGRFHCETCAFAEPCLGKNRGEDYVYTLNSMFERRKRHYWEDAPPTTDKKMESV